MTVSFPAAAIGARDFFPQSEMPAAVRERLMNKILGRVRITDPAFDDYFQRISIELAPEDNYLITTANIDQVNAFAYFGGCIVIMKGIWKLASNEDGFVGIVAHEMAHVKQDHFRRTKEVQETITAITIPLLIAGLLSDSSEVRNAVVSGSAGIITGQLYAHSRELEHEADVLGLEMMANSGHNGQYLAELLGKLSGGGAEYVSTHPAPLRRAAYIKDRLLSSPIRGEKNSLDFLLLKEKLSLSGVPEDEKNTKQRMLAQATSDKKTALQFALLALAIKTRDKVLAQSMFDSLQPVAHPFVVAERAEYLSRLGGNNKQALAILAQARRDFPESAALGVRQLIVMRRANDYRNLLKTYKAMPKVLRERSDTLREASQAAATLKQRGYANLLLAKAHAAQGYFELAERQLTIAEKYKMKPNLLLAVSTLSKQIKKEIEILKEKS
jgi:predicted Zn-dependent protease